MCATDPDTVEQIVQIPPKYSPKTKSAETNGEKKREIIKISDVQ